MRAIKILNISISIIKGNLGRLQSPWALLTGIVSGIVIGLFYPNLAETIAPGGTLFLAMLQMCVLPIMFAAVASSVTNLLLSKEASRNLGRILVTFTLALFLSAALGTFLGMAGKPGMRIDQETRVSLGKMLSHSPSSETEAAKDDRFSPDSYLKLSDPLNKRDISRPSLLQFLATLIPTNIFRALSRGENLQILVFALVFGIALATIPTDHSANIIQGMAAIFKAFENIIAWVMYILPFGLCSLVADQIARTGFNIIISMAYFIAIIFMGALFITVINTLVIAKTAGVSLVASTSALRRTLIIALGTRNSFAAMPSALDAMSQALSLDKKTCNLLIPLGITLCRFGTVMAFALITLFFAQLYGVSLTPLDYIMITAGSVIAAIASAGMPGVVALSMLSLLFTPLELPLETAITIMLAIDPIIDPVMTLVNVHTNCAATAAIAGSSV